MVFGHEGRVWLYFTVVLIRGLEVIWILYTLYMWHYYKESRLGIWEGGRRQRGKVSVSLDLSQLNPWPFWHPPTASYTKPPGMTVLSKAWGCCCREEMALLKCYSKCFCHKLVNLFHVFLLLWNLLLCLACHHNGSCSLQTICSCWTYFISVFRLAWHSWRDSPKIKQSLTRRGLVLDQDCPVCFWLGLCPEDSVFYGHHIWIR